MQFFGKIFHYAPKTIIYEDRPQLASKRINLEPQPDTVNHHKTPADDRNGALKVHRTHVEHYRMALRRRPRVISSS